MPRFDVRLHFESRVKDPNWAPYFLLLSLAFIVDRVLDN